MAPDRTRATYDRIAGRLADINAAMPPALAEAVERFLGYVGPGASVLDLGCGAGRDMAWLAAVGVVVVGAGFSPSMLAEARMRANGPLVLDGLEEPVFGQ